MQIFSLIDSVGLILLALGAGGVVAFIVTGVMWRRERLRLRYRLKQYRQAEEIWGDRIGVWEAFLHFER